MIVHLVNCHPYYKVRWLIGGLFALKHVDLLPLIQNMPKEMVKILYDCVVAYDMAHYTVVTMPDHRRVSPSPDI